MANQSPSSRTTFSTQLHSAEQRMQRRWFDLAMAEQAQADDPQLDPARSRGGILELELAVDAIHALVNDMV